MTCRLDLTDSAGLLQLAKRQGELAGRFGSPAEVNPFQPDSTTGQAWEAGRSEAIERSRSADLFDMAPKRRRARA